MLNNLKKQLRNLRQEQTGLFLFSQLTHTMITLSVLALLLVGARQVGALSGVLKSASAPVAGTSFTTINYQGRLADGGGDPIDNTNPGLGMTFSLYAEESGGSPVWTETHANVPVSDGLFSVKLGSVNALSTDLLGDDLWLGIQVGSDPEMTPREKLAAVPYAMVAGEALTVPDGSIGVEQIADDAVTLEKLGLAKYYVQGGTNDDPSLVRYTGPSGQKTMLDTASCSAEEWCCNAEKTICYHQKSDEDTIMEFSLEGAPSYICTLLHSEDDDPDILYYATDGGNGCHTKDGGWCARLRNEGITSSSPVRKNRNFYWLCGW